MEERSIRTAMLIGEDGIDKLSAARVAVFGIGGVGGYVVEALARAGVGAIDLIDNDRVSLSNINRQIIATQSTVGAFKVDAAEERILSINPACRVKKHNVFVLPDTASEFDFTEYSYVVDAIDTVSGKIALATLCEKAGVPIISSMGTGNKLDPTAFEVTDIYKTSVCPLARTMRYELKRRGVKRLKVVYSKEEPRRPLPEESFLAENSGAKSDTPRRAVPASISFVPSVAGLIIASEVVKGIISK